MAKKAAVVEQQRHFVSNKCMAALIRSLDTMKREVDKLEAPRQEDTARRRRMASTARSKAVTIRRRMYVIDRFVSDKNCTVLDSRVTAGSFDPYINWALGHRGLGVPVDKLKDAQHARWVEARVKEFDQINAAKQNAPETRMAEMERHLRTITIPGFFPTPPELAKEVIKFADIKPGQLVLEPSAGKGDLADLARAAGAKVCCIEVNSHLCSLLEVKGYGTADQPDAEHIVICAEFETIAPDLKQVDRVIMNPPFERMSDIKHVQLAYTLLKPGGILVAVMNKASFDKRSTLRARREFNGWLDTVISTVVDVRPDMFATKEAFNKTGTRTSLLVLVAPK